LTRQRADPAHQAELRGIQDPEDIVYQHERVILLDDAHVDPEQRGHDHGKAICRAKQEVKAMYIVYHDH